MTAATEIVAAASFPVVTTAAIVGYYVLTGSGGASPPIAAYMVVAAAIGLIILHEIFVPERSEWRAGQGEAATDFVFLVLVQVLLPQFLALLAAMWMADTIAQEHWLLSDVWPHQWPIWAQFLLMTVLAEFPRYWLHRALHTVEPLWRFHAVHHAPRILYWLNVGRFHPVDKTLQFIVETLPFILIGVAPEVLGLYFVFYAVTGFYQHSNCRVRLGPLNWIIAGPELHRWHHSILPEESNTNYGNKLILWDMVFGTRFLPAGRSVGRLGVPDATYPTDFIRQMAAPFEQRPRR